MGGTAAGLNDSCSNKAYKNTTINWKNIIGPFNISSMLAGLFWTAMAASRLKKLVYSLNKRTFATSIADSFNSLQKRPIIRAGSFLILSSINRISSRTGSCLP